MKRIKNVKLGFNKDAEVTIVADVEMNGKEDIDSLFLCFFTILHPPLRLSVITAGCLNDELVKLTGQNKDTIEKLMKENPEMYGLLIQENTENLLHGGEEQNKILLDSPNNSQNARLILTSMLDRGFYHQKTRYYFSNGDKEKQEQKVDIAPLKQAFEAMLEICKKWDDPKLKDELQ